MSHTDSIGDTPSATHSRLHLPLLEDGGLLLTADAELRPTIRRWIPRFLESPSTGTSGSGALIELRSAAAPLPPAPNSPPTLRLVAVRAWLGEGRAILRGSDESAGGTIDLATRHAILQVPLSTPADPDPALDAFTLLTVAAALLLVRSGRALLHSAAVLSPEGDAWLLVGDTHAGKTTTTLNLVRAGHGFLSDDHVVLRRAAASGRATVEGWPRTFHVDEGWETGTVTGRRRDFDPASLGEGRWRRSAPLGGLLFPRIEADLPTAVLPISPGEALARLIRQSPWFLADRAAASEVLQLLQTSVHLPAFELRLGRDSYADPALLDARLKSLRLRLPGG